MEREIYNGVEVELEIEIEEVVDEPRKRLLFPAPIRCS